MKPFIVGLLIGLVASIFGIFFGYKVALLIILSYFILHFLFIIWLRILFKKADNCLVKECDPEKYLIYIQRIKKFVKISIRELFFKINEAISLRNLGKIDDALFALQSVNLSLYPYKDAYIRKLSCLYYNNMADLYILKKDLKIAQEYISFGRDFLSKSNLNIKQVTQFEYYYNSNQFSLNMLNNNIDGCEDFFVNALERPQNNYQRIESNFDLARFYYFTKQYAKAEPLLKYIIANGNKLFHVKIAQEYMENFKEN